MRKGTHPMMTELTDMERRLIRILQANGVSNPANEPMIHRLAPEWCGVMNGRSLLVGIAMLFVGINAIRGHLLADESEDAGSLPDESYDALISEASDLGLLDCSFLDLRI